MDNNKPLDNTINNSKENHNKENQNTLDKKLSHTPIRRTATRIATLATGLTLLTTALIGAPTPSYAHAFPPPAPSGPAPSPPGPAPSPSPAPAPSSVIPTWPGCKNTDHSRYDLAHFQSHLVLHGGATYFIVSGGAQASSLYDIVEMDANINIPAHGDPGLGRGIVPYLQNYVNEKAGLLINETNTHGILHNGSPFPLTITPSGTRKGKISHCGKDIEITYQVYDMRDATGKKYVIQPGDAIRLTSDMASRFRIGSASPLPGTAPPTTDPGTTTPSTPETPDSTVDVRKLRKEFDQHRGKFKRIHPDRKKYLVGAGPLLFNPLEQPEGGYDTHGVLTFGWDSIMLHLGYGSNDQTTIFHNKETPVSKLYVENQTDAATWAAGLSWLPFQNNHVAAGIAARFFITNSTTNQVGFEEVYDRYGLVEKHDPINIPGEKENQNTGAIGPEFVGYLGENWGIRFAPLITIGENTDMAYEAGVFVRF